MPDSEANLFQRNRVKVLILLNLAALIAIDLLAGWLFIPKEYLKIEIFDRRFHHGLRPSSATTYQYGTRKYHVMTNSLGLRDSTVRDVPLEVDRRRILFMGDSFTEGVGVNFEESFVGRIVAGLAPHSIDVLNGGVKSYCPKLYYLKTRYLVETVGLKFDELFVMIDVSDIPDELVYESFEPSNPSPPGGKGYRVQRTLKKRSYSVYSYNRWKNARRQAITPVQPGAPDFTQTKGFSDASLGLWTVREDLFEAYGKKGLDLAQNHLLDLIEFCRARNIRVTIGVYPNSNLAELDGVHSVQVEFWRAFSKKNKINFLSFFPLFINDQTFEYIYRTFFIPGDLHWNSEGHRIVADALIRYILQTPQTGN